jgi:hypothetical protein
MGLVTTASAQEAVRLSMVDAEAAAARARTAAQSGYYNLKLGPTSWRFGAGLGVDYNDNVNYTQTNPESDFIFRPQIDAQLFWPVSDKNSLDLKLGAGYSAYVEHPGLSRWFITPDSGLSFNIYAGDFLINLHDRVSITENTYQDPTVAGTGGYSELQNTVGATTQWDLNKVLLRLDYDHENYVGLSGTQSQPSGQSELFSWSGGYAPKSGTLFGVQVGGALIHYADPSSLYSDATEWNAGGFYNAQLTEHIHSQLTGGYTVYTPTSAQTTAQSFDGIYGQLTLNHQISRHVDYSLGGGRNLTTTLQGGTIDTYNANLQINWHIIRQFTLGTSFVYNHGTQLSTTGEIYDQYGPQITLGRALTEKLTGSIGYQMYWRNSNEAGRDYTVSIVSLNLNYRF